MPGRYALLCLCTLGFLKEFRPSESFLTQYLQGQKNFTREEVNQEIYPVGTYSTLLLLILVFLITDILRYKPVIIVHSLSGVICYSFMTFGVSKDHVQTAEVAYGLFLASEVAYSTYMYASCEKDMYRKVTSYTRIALQAGRLTSGAVGQLLISCAILNFHQLNFLSLAGLSSSAVIGCLLPSTIRSVYFHRHLPERDNNVGTSQIICDDKDAPANEDLLASKDEITSPNTAADSLQHNSSDGNIGEISGFKKIWDDFLHAYSDLYVVKWSLWWAFMQCGYLQVTSYVQNLWQDTVDLSGGDLYNGAASAMYTILGIAASWLVGQLKFNLDEKKSHWLLSVCSLMSGSLIIYSSLCYSLMLQYVAYGAYKILFQVMMIFANTEVAKSLTRDSHGLVFGFNTFIALLLQTILTLIVTGKGGFQLSTRLQFIVYGCYYVMVSCGFLVMAILNSVKERLRLKQQLKCTLTQAEAPLQPLSVP